MLVNILARMFLLILPFSSGEAIHSDVSSFDYVKQSSSRFFLPKTYPSCFTEGTTWSVDALVDMVPEIQTVYSCQDLCLDSPNCRQFTWYDQPSPFGLTCFLFGSTTTEFSCTDCVSGPQSCTCDIPKPPNHGDWFCPSSISPSTCYLECDPGYVSTNVTVITCHHGEWSAAPSCVAAVALITGNYNSPSNTVEVYGKQLHKKLPNLPEGRYCHTVDLVNSLVLLCGGGDYTDTSCLTLTSSQQWTPHSNTIMERYIHSSVSILGQLHLMGGSYSKSTTEYLAPPSEQWHPSWDLLEEVYGTCAVKTGHEVFMMTGGDYYPSSVVSYNVTSGAATRFQDLIQGRWNHGCVYLKEPTTRSGRVLVAGGYNIQDLSSSEMYDIDQGGWDTMGELTTRRYGVSMVVLGDTVLAMGGWDGRHSLSSVDRFNWTSMQWTATERMMERRNYHAVTGVPPSAVGIGHKGATGNGNFL